MKIPGLRLLTLILAWGAAAAAAGSARLIAQAPAFAPPLLIGALTAGFAAAVMRVRWMRAAVESMGVRSLVATHLVRFIGLYFIWLHGQGRLPAEFAERAGWGDVAAAAGALGLLFWPDGPGFRRAAGAWNLFGILDLGVAVGTATWLNASRPGSMAEIAGLPLALVPLWLVPMLMTCHLVILGRLARNPASA